MPKRYPSEFRRRVLDLLAAGRSVAEVARDLEIPNQTIYLWRRQEAIDKGLDAKKREGVPSEEPDQDLGDHPCAHRPEVGTDNLLAARVLLGSQDLGLSRTDGRGT